MLSCPVGFWISSGMEIQLFLLDYVEQRRGISFGKLCGDREKSDEPLDFHWGLMEDSPVCDDQAFLPATYIQQYHQDGKFQDQKEYLRWCGENGQTSVLEDFPPRYSNNFLA